MLVLKDRDRFSSLPILQVQTATSHHDVGEALHVRRNYVRLMRSVTEGQLATVDECRMHARGLGPDAIENVAGDEEDFGHAHAHDLGGLGVCCYVGFE